MKPKSVISSASNPQIKNLTLLQKKAKARKEQKVFVVEGIKMFHEARREGLLKKAYLSESFYQEKLSQDPEFLKDLDYEVVVDSVFKEASDTMTPQGIMGVVKEIQYSLDKMIDVDNPCLLLLEDIRDPGNLGTMIRTAEGAGMTGIILSSSCVDIYNPKVIRSTMGSLYRMPFYQCEDFNLTLKEIKKRGIILFAAHLQGIAYDTEGSFQRKCGFLIGNEANGLSDGASALADVLIKIPMEGQVESLNAAIAAAILMYEAHRQRSR